MTASRLPGLIQRNALTLAAVGLVIACGVAPGRSPAPSAAATASPTMSDSTTMPTTAPTTAPTAQATPTNSPTTAAAPPAAMLAAGITDATGWLGTYCWHGTCADVLQLPPKTNLPELTLGAGDGQLVFTLALQAGFTTWAASYSDAMMDDLVPLGSGGQPYDPDATATVPPLFSEATFDAPPSGDWALLVVVHFVDGDAQYAWHVTVP